MLFKKTIVIWSDDLDNITEVGTFAVEAIRSSDGVVGFGHPVVRVEDPLHDPDYEPAVEEAFGV